MGQKLDKLPGFRDFFPETCAVRNYVFSTWRRVAARYGFAEYEGPILEPTDLYRRKSGEEITEQLFHFVDKGDREVALRPELTPTLARMAAAKQREYRKPMKWCSVGPFFRYEKQQKGRLREFYQFNCDILGEVSEQADAELIALAIDLMREFGFREGDFVIRVSDRGAWTRWLTGKGLNEEDAGLFLQIVDKLERESPEKTDEKLKPMGSSLEEVRAFMAGGEDVSELMPRIRASLAARGLDRFLQWDLSIVRGLAYYTGVVFEVFDAGQGMRAVAGGGRYDKLVQLIGGVNMAAAGFAMGDVVIANLIEETPHAKERMDRWVETQKAVEVYVVVAQETRRADALAGVQRLRDAGRRVDYTMEPKAVGKQFQAAELAGARLAVVYGDEFPSLKIKSMATRAETESSVDRLAEDVTSLL